MSSYGIDENGDIDIGKIVVGSQEVLERIHISLATQKGTVNDDLDFGVDYLTALSSFSTSLEDFTSFIEPDIRRVLADIPEIVEVGGVVVEKVDEQFRIIVEISFDAEGEVQTIFLEHYTDSFVG